MMRFILNSGKFYAEPSCRHYYVQQKDPYKTFVQTEDYTSYKVLNILEFCSVLPAVSNLCIFCT